TAMRLLPVGSDHGRGGPARGQPRPERRGHRCRDDQYLPVRHLQPDQGGDQARGRARLREADMAGQISISRRGFLASTMAGGLCLGLRIPVPGAAMAQEGAPTEVNAWVVIHPDDTVVIRVARVEMGQGTLTGLAQLVAEELDADWEKVRTEYPTPGESVARNRVWGPFGTYGSQGIRASQQYMREGGATARAMLLRAAADRWGVEPETLTVSRGVISGPDGQTLRYGELAADAAAVEVPS